MALPQTYLDQIKKFEGFHQKPYWDYKQWTVGHGTRAAGPNDVVDQAEADRRLQAEIAKAAALVDGFAPGIDPGTRAALTSLTFNAGGDWMNSGLGQAIKAGNLDQARASFQQYVKAGGQTLPGLVNRRQAELGWFGQNANDPRNVAMNSGSAGVDPDGAYGVAGPIQTADVGDAGVTMPQSKTPAGGVLTGSQQGQGMLAGLFDANEGVTGGDVFKAVLGGLGNAFSGVPQAQAPQMNLQMVEARAPKVDLSGLSQAVRKRKWGL